MHRLYDLLRCRFTVCILFVILLICPVAVNAQHIVKKHTVTTGQKKSVSLGILSPVGSFSQTHYLGATISYSHSKHRFIPLKTPAVTAIGFTWQGDISWYAGKNEKHPDFSYKYPGYTFINAYAGIIFNRDKKWMGTIVAGPGMGFYNGLTRFNMGSDIKILYSISRHISVGPILKWMKESIARPIWAAGIQSSFAF